MQPSPNYPSGPAEQPQAPFGNPGFASPGQQQVPPAEQPQWAAPGQWPSGPLPPHPMPTGQVPGQMPGQMPPGGFGAPVGAGNAVQPATFVAFLGVIVVTLGLSLPFDASAAWSTQTAWSVFAILAGLTAAIGPLVKNSVRSPRVAWFVSAGATAALLAYWLLIVLPGVASNPGFTLTLGVSAVAAATWFSPVRPR